MVFWFRIMLLYAAQPSILEYLSILKNLMALGRLFFRIMAIPLVTGISGFASCNTNWVNFSLLLFLLIGDSILRNVFSISLRQLKKEV